MAQSAESFGGLDVVVANVSALAFPDTEESWVASLNVDLMHTVRLVRAAMPHLEASESASIIAISSVSGRESDFASGPYGTAKTAIVGYLNGLAMQLAMTDVNQRLTAKSASALEIVVDGRGNAMTTQPAFTWTSTSPSVASTSRFQNGIASAYFSSSV